MALGQLIYGCRADGEGLIAGGHDRHRQGGITDASRSRRRHHKAINPGHGRGAAQGAVRGNGKPGRATDLGVGDRIRLRVNRRSGNGLADISGIEAGLRLGKRRRAEMRRLVGAMVPMAGVSLIIVMTDHTGSISGAIGSVDNGVPHLVPKWQALGVGLRGHVIIMAQGTGVASGTAVQAVDIIHSQQLAGASNSNRPGIAGVTESAIQAAVIGNAPLVMVAGGGIDGLMVGQILTMADDAVPTAVRAAIAAAVMAGRQIDQSSIRAMTTGAGVMDARIIRVYRIPGRSVTAGTVLVTGHLDHAAVVDLRMIVNKETVAGIAGIGGSNCRPELARCQTNQGPGGAVAFRATTMFLGVSGVDGHPIASALGAGVAVGTISRQGHPERVIGIGVDGRETAMTQRALPATGMIRGRTGQGAVGGVARGASGMDLRIIRVHRVAGGGVATGALGGHGHP